MSSSRIRWYYACFCAILSAHALATVAQTLDPLTSALIAPEMPPVSSVAAREVTEEVTRRSAIDKGKKPSTGSPSRPTPKGHDQVVKLRIKQVKNDAAGKVKPWLNHGWNPDVDLPLWELPLSESQIVDLEVEYLPKEKGSSENGPDFATENDEIGFIQTLDRSSRVATYEDGGTLTVHPKSKLPLIDSEDRFKPWYKPHEKVKSSGEQNFYFDDATKFCVPSYADKGDQKMPLELVKVNEHFTLRLYNKNQKKTLMQWTWEYSYKVKFKAGGEEFEPVTDFQSREAAAVTPVTLPPESVLEGDYVTQNLQYIWSNGYSTKHKWVNLDQQHDDSGGAGQPRTARRSRQRKWALSR